MDGSLLKYEDLSNSFYIYAYLDSNKIPYYIGKGIGRRAYRKNAETTSSVVPPKDKSCVVIVASNLTEKLAFTYERILIEQYGRIDKGTGILQNRTDGGEGSSGSSRGPCSKETKNKISQTLKIVNKGSGNGMFGRNHSPETIALFSKQRKGISSHQKGKKQATDKCPHCSSIGGKGIMKRWHFNNCKNKI